MNTNLSISIEKDGFPSETYQNKILLSDKDPITNITFEEGFKAAQTHYLPYYIVAIIKVKDKAKSGQNNFIFHEGSPFYSHMQIDKKEARDCSCIYHAPGLRRIQSIYYFALECFKFNQKTLFDLTVLEDPTIAFRVMKLNYPIHTKQDKSPNNNQKKIESLFMESLLIGHNEESAIVTGNKQFWISNLIHGMHVFPTFSFEDREIEEIKWLWCSYKSPACTLKTIIILSYKCFFSCADFLEIDLKLCPSIIAKKDILPLSHRTLNSPCELTKSFLSSKL